MKLRLNSAKAEAQASSLSLAELGKNVGLEILPKTKVSINL